MHHEKGQVRGPAITILGVARIFRLASSDIGEVKGGEVVGGG
jgi:hypothetical protein